MPLHTVRKLARLSGISVRTLHHYDDIGLLKPARIGANGYRFYGEAELLRLQQILLHRELGLPLAAIAELLDAGDADRLAQLHRHRAQLVERAGRYRELIATIDATIASLQENTPMKPEQLYAGFSAEKQAEYEAWLIERKGEPMRRSIEESRRAMAGWPAGRFEQLGRELGAVESALASLCLAQAATDDPRLAPLLSRHRDWVSAMWGKPCPLTAYAGLADLYDSHPDFRSRYEALAPGFADYLPRAMRAWAAQAA